MKTPFIATIFSALLTLSIVGACKGPAGEVGPKGSTGATGTTGATGPKGDAGANGNANAVYSDWKTPVWDGPVTGIGSAGGNVYLSLASTANALLTKEAINTAAIYTYIKYNDLVQDPTNAQLFTLSERITSNISAVDYFKIPGRTTNTKADYAYANVSYDTYGENYFAPSILVQTIPYDNTKSAYVPIPDLTNKTAAFYKDLVKTVPQFRQVIVYGNVKGGRLASINWKDYSEVQKVLDLND